MRLLDQIQQQKDTKLLIGPENTISQTFVSKYDNLAGIRILFYNFNLGGNKIYQISISDNNSTLRQETVTESNIGWEMLFRYDFDPIINSSGKIYSVNISSLEQDKSAISLIQKFNLHRAKINLSQENDSGNPEVNNQERKFLNVAYNNEDAYPSGNAKLQSINLPGDIVFETYYTNTPLKMAQNVLNQSFTHFFADKTFSIFYIVFIFALTIVTLKQLRKSSSIKK